MKTITINVDSWFNRCLSSFYTDLYWDDLDFCSYCRKALWFILVAVAGLTVATLLSAIVGHGLLSDLYPTFLEWSRWIRLPTTLLVGFLVICIGISAFFGLIVAVFATYETLKAKYRAWKRKNFDSDQEPSAIASGYLALKDKVCFKINPVRKS